MERRELLKMIALATGAAVVGGELLLTGCKSGASGSALNFNATNLALLDEIGETIIPTTNTPGAKAAKIAEYMKIMVTDCYTEKQQSAFAKGVSAIQDACKKAAGKSFMDCDTKQRHDFLVSLEKEAKTFNDKVNEENKIKKEAFDKTNNALPWKDQKEFEGEPIHYYTMLKQLTLNGFFSSKTGMTETLRHVAVPTKFDGNVPYVKGEKAWAE